MTVWVFGDSFSRISEHSHYEQWMVTVARMAQHPLRCLGVKGSSLEYTYKVFNTYRSKIERNDIIIINLTGTNRRWFFRDLPGHNISTSPHDDDRESAAMTAYREYLNNKEATFIYLTNFLYNLYGLTKKLDLHVILMINNSDLEDYIKDKIRTFPLFNIAKGMLSEVSIQEFSKSYIIANYEQFGIRDPRLNHLCRRNHFILSNKILRNIITKAPIDLEQGFSRGFITSEELEDESFIESELFGATF